LKKKGDCRDINKGNRGDQAGQHKKKLKERNKVSNKMLGMIRKCNLFMWTPEVEKLCEAPKGKAGALSA